MPVHVSCPVTCEICKKTEQAHLQCQNDGVKMILTFPNGWDRKIIKRKKVVNICSSCNTEADLMVLLE